METMRSIIRIIFCLILTVGLAQPVYSAGFVGMTAPMPPYSINKGLRVKGIAVDTLVMLMALSGVPIQPKDVKLMLWSHALQIGAAGPRKIVLNVPRTPNVDGLFKWVGPLAVTKYVIIGRKDGKKFKTLNDLNKFKVGTLRNSLSEKALLASGVQKSALASSVSHVIPLKKLDTKKIDFFAHGNTSTAYLMKSLGMKSNKYEILHTYMEVPLYYAFSKDTSDKLIKKLNDNLAKLKKPGRDGKSRLDKIVAKYLPSGILE